jgi:DNA-binding MarR family transcriptional regulator
VTGQPPETDAPDGGLGHALERAARTWRAEVNAALEPWGVTAPQFFVLVAVLRAALRGKLPPTQRDIGERLSMDPNTASALIRSLERRHLLARGPHPADGRAFALTLTGEGRELASTCARLVRVVNDRYFSVLDPAQAHALSVILTKLAAESKQRG